MHDKLQNIKDWIYSIGARGVLGLLRLMGLRRASNLGGCVLRMVGPYLPAHRIGVRNIEFIFPENTPDQNVQILRDAWENLGRVSGELPNLDRITLGGKNPNMVINNPEVLTSYLDKNQPVILFTGHYGNWELAAYGTGYLGAEQTIIYRAANNVYVDRMIQKFRKATKGIFVPKGSSGVRDLMKNIKEGHCPAMLLDQKLNSGIAVPFFGKPAMTAPMAAQLALKFNLPLLPLRVRRDKDGLFRLTFDPAIEVKPSGHMDQDVYDITLKINQTYERWIRDEPGYWLWFHRRWPKEFYKKQS